MLSEQEREWLERMVADRMRMPVYDYAHFEITEEK